MRKKMEKMERLLSQFDNCIQNEEPFCTAKCPFHLDVLDFLEKMGRNSYRAAYKTLRNAMGFPDLVSELCQEPCAAICPRKETDAAVRLGPLEKTCVARAGGKEPTDYNLPEKAGRVAVVGGGVSGAACALKLAQRKYQVTLFEKNHRLGGQLLSLLDEKLVEEEFARQFRYEKVDFRWGREVLAAEDVYREGYDCVYVATGRDGPDFGLSDASGKGLHCRLNTYTDDAGEKRSAALFAGGDLTGFAGIFDAPANEREDLVYALAVGIRMARQIETYLKTKKVEYIQKEKKNKLAINQKRLKKTSCRCEGKEILSDEEVREETARCVRCRCDFCLQSCDLVNFYQKLPLTIRKEVTATIAPSESFMHGTPSIRLINTCTGCKVCERICPSGVQLGELLAQARRRLHNTEKMPRGYHQYWLSDMEFANGPFAAICKKSPHAKPERKAEYAFFPGCQLGASDPEYVAEVYRRLLEKRRDTALLVRCCGIHAAWSGDEKKALEQSEELRADWEELGRPTLIAACPTCLDHLQKYLPEIPVLSVYEIMLKWGIPLREKGGRREEEGIRFGIFDSCKTADQPAVRSAVRSLLEQADLSYEELPDREENGCCSYGGQSRSANPRFAAQIAGKREALSDDPYIVYCINCRDIFLGDQKPCMHVFDLLLGRSLSQVCSEPLPDLNQRRANRTALKRRMLREFWNEEAEMPEERKLTLIIGEDILKKMNKQRILRDNVCGVVELAEKWKRRIYHPETDSYTCFRQIGHITVWVEYKKGGVDVFEILNVYSHMVQLELEEVWNGRKTDFDLR